MKMDDLKRQMEAFKIDIEKDSLESNKREEYISKEWSPKIKDDREWIGQERRAVEEKTEAINQISAK